MELPRGPAATELPPSHYSATRAAALAACYICHRLGSPGHGLAPRTVRRAHRQVVSRLKNRLCPPMQCPLPCRGGKVCQGHVVLDIDGVGHKYYLELVLEDITDNDRTVNCTAEVLYHLGNKNIAPDVQFTTEGELQNTDEADNIFYNRIKSLEKELVAENIPDSHGNVSPEMQPIQLLAWVASGFVIWQNSTENTKFQLAQIKHVKQVKRSDEYLEFDYKILLHEMVSQEIIPWQMTVLWHPQHGVQVTQDSRQPKHASE